jgi:hypothetical protein
MNGYTLDELFQPINDEASLRNLARRLIRKHRDRPSMTATWLASEMMLALPVADHPRCHAIAREVLAKMFAPRAMRRRRRAKT